MALRAAEFFCFRITTVLRGVLIRKVDILCLARFFGYSAAVRAKYLSENRLSLWPDSEFLCIWPAAQNVLLRQVGFTALRPINIDVFFYLLSSTVFVDCPAVATT